MRCPYYIANKCRSCSEVDRGYAEQIADKQQRVAQILSGFVKDSQWLEPVLSAESGFRNRAKLVVGGRPGKLQFGILDRGFHSVDLRHCPLYDESMQRTIAQVAAYLNRLGISGYDVKKRNGQLKYVLLTQSSRGKYLLRFVLASKKWLLPLQQTLSHLHRYCPNLEVVSVNILPEAVALLEGEEEIILTEKTELDFPLEVIPGKNLVLKLGPKCFFQTNTAVATQLYAQAVSWVEELGLEKQGGASLGERSESSGKKGEFFEADIDISTENNGEVGTDAESRVDTVSTGAIVDLYCGVGGFGLALAQVNPKVPVYGVEISETAVVCAQKAAAEMGITNAVFESSSADSIITAKVAETPVFLRRPAVMVVNPPRRGIGVEVCEWIDRVAKPRQLIYSSCNPQSLAQDLGMLSQYQVKAARIFDMFAHSQHVETIALIQRVES